MMINEVRVRLSWGLVALAMIHVVAFGVLTYLAHPQKPTSPVDPGWQLPSHYTGDAVGARKFQAVDDLPAVDRDATYEIKQQACSTGTCSPAPCRHRRCGLAW